MNDFNQLKEKKITSSVIIYDKDYKVIKVILDAMAKTYFQEVSGDQPVQVGLFKNRNKKNRYNFFGLYQPQKDHYLLPCNYEDFMIMKDHTVCAITETSNYKAIAHIINPKNQKSIQTIDDYKENIVVNYDRYIWVKNGENRYNIYDEDFNLINTAVNDGKAIYSEDGSVHITSKKLAKKLGRRMKKPIICDMKIPCWSTGEKAISCDLYDECGDEVDEDGKEVFINRKYKVIVQNDCLNNGILRKIGDYYCYIGEAFEYGEVYDIDGNWVKSSTGVKALSCEKTEDGYVFFGYQNKSIYSFNEKGEILGYVHTTEMEWFDEFDDYKQFSNVIVASDFDGNTKIFYKGRNIYKGDSSIDKNKKVFCTYEKENGEIVICIGSRLLMIDREGKILSDNKIEGEVLHLSKDYYVVHENGQTLVKVEQESR